MLKAYRRWNTFEKKYFWSKTLYIGAFGGYSINLLTNPIYISPIFYRVGVITVIIALTAYAINLMKRSLSRQEREWKGLIIDPITNKEIAVN